MESAIVNLRAEVHKKRSEASKLSNETKFKQRLKPIIKDSRSSKKDVPNNTQDKELCSDEDALKLEKSRQALEKKAALYDQLKSGTEVLEDDELNQKFLVDFQEKIYKQVSDAKKEREKKLNVIEPSEEEDSDAYKAKDSSEEWVEYTDSFGRTRICQRKDMEYHKAQQTREELTAQETRSKFLEHWEQVEQETSQKQDVHYQDVLYDEARSHGTGFMPFSRDEEKRAAQQQFLKDLGSEAQKAAVSKESLNRKRQKMMQERLAKVRQRKRLKMRLPIQDDSLKTPPPSDEEEEKEETKVLPPELPLPPSTTEKEPIRVREWDLGKPGVGSTMSQEQWIESQRKIRENDFAPPTSYDRGTTSSKYHPRPPPATAEKGRSSFTRPPPTTSRSCGETEELKPTEAHRSGAAIAPPSTYDYYRPTSTTKRNFSLGRRVDVESAISQGLARLRQQQEGGSEG